MLLFTLSETFFLYFFFLPWHKMDWDSCSCQSSKMDFFKNGSIGILNKISCIQICLKKCHIYLHTFGILVIWISLKGISWELLEQMCICLYHWLWSHQHQLHLCKVKLKTMYMCNYVKFTVKLINSYQKKISKKKINKISMTETMVKRTILTHISHNRK